MIRLQDEKTKLKNMLNRAGNVDMPASYLDSAGVMVQAHIVEMLVANSNGEVAKGKICI